MKIFTSLLLIFAVFLCFVGCASSDTPSDIQQSSQSEAPEQHVTLIFAQNGSAESVTGQTVSFFAQKATELSGGTLSFDIHHTGELGTQDAVFQALLGSSTAVDMSALPTYFLASYGAEKNSLLALPFAFDGVEHFNNFALSSLADEFLAEPADIGLPLHGVFYATEGERHFFMSTVINTPADILGKSVAVHPDDLLSAQFVSSLGGLPTNISDDGLSAALEETAVLGGTQTLLGYSQNSLYQHAPNIILSAHALDVTQVVISDLAWEKLSENQRSAIMQAGRLAVAHNAEILPTQQQTALASLEQAGVNIVTPDDLTAWSAAAQPLTQTALTPTAQKFYDQITAMK